MNNCQAPISSTTTVLQNIIMAIVHAFDLHEPTIVFKEDNCFQINNILNPGKSFSIVNYEKANCFQIEYNDGITETEVYMNYIHNLQIAAAELCRKLYIDPPVPHSAKLYQYLELVEFTRGLKKFIPELHMEFSPDKLNSIIYVGGGEDNKIITINRVGVEVEEYYLQTPFDSHDKEQVAILQDVNDQLEYMDTIDLLKMYFFNKSI